MKITLSQEQFDRLASGKTVDAEVSIDVSGHEVELSVTLFVEFGPKHRVQKKNDPLLYLEQTYSNQSEVAAC